MKQTAAQSKKPLFQRKTLSLSQEAMVEAAPLSDSPGSPMLLRPAVEGVDLTTWAAANRVSIEKWLVESGGILFRGFRLSGAGDFEDALRAICGELLEYKERSSPRHTVQGNVYTSTDLAKDQAIFPHNENSYQSTWPLRIAFFCLIPALRGGETPLVSSRQLYSRIPSAIRNRFEKKGLQYIRRYSGFFGLSWQEAFQTAEPARVEEYCRNHGLQAIWDGAWLETRSFRPAIALHPVTNEPLWFNHAAFFHASTIPTEVASVILSQFGRARFPNDVTFGDGSVIEDEIIQEIRSIYIENKVSFPWQESDLLLLDNMLTLHGREPFEGDRKIVVGMAQPYGT